MGDVIQRISYGEFFSIVFFSFAALYFTLSLPVYFWTKEAAPCRQEPLRPGQIRKEIQASLLSISVFAAMSAPVLFGLKSGFFRVDFSFSAPRFFAETLALFLWNETHFFAMHRLLHFPFLFRFAHHTHHASLTTTPFSSYSFHWLEALLLGSVMPLAMLVHNFSFWSLLTLPVFSLALNALGHSNRDFFPEYSLEHVLSFSRRHARHHTEPHSHFGFSLPYLDRLFGGLL
jgi:sterol desaturase/sphingolipid hydroxylase (fatty acid hydroxylase superfamily)